MSLIFNQYELEFFKIIDFLKIACTILDSPEFHSRDFKANHSRINQLSII